MNNKKVEYNSKYQTGKEDGFIILDKKEVPVDKLFKTYEKALKYIQKHGKIMDITDSTFQKMNFGVGGITDILLLCSLHILDLEKDMVQEA